MNRAASLIEGSGITEAHALALLSPAWAEPRRRGEGPQVESRSGWDVDGVEIRVILDFRAGFVDHRGWFMNPGA